MEAKDRIIFAADVGSIAELREYLSKFKGRIGGVKLGMELLTHSLLTGEPVFQTVLEETDLKIMWDLKYGDIPSTVAKAAKEVAKYGQRRILGFTVHCLSGQTALRDAVRAVEENFGKGQDAPMVIGITLLTSLDQGDLGILGIEGTPKEVVLRWAKIAADAGVPAIVCSPQETADVLALNPEFVVINPGIRFAGSDVGKQKRVGTPGGAIQNGASYIVMGSDLRKGDPEANARRAEGEIMAAEYHPLTESDILRIFGEMGAIYDNDHFVYTKGGHGKAYVNKDDIYVDPDKLSELCRDIAWNCRNMEVQAVAGPTVGGVLVAQWVAYWLRRFTGRRFTGDDKIVAVFADETGEGKRVLKRNFPKRVAGKKVLVVEDVINTGASAGATVKAILEAGGEVVGCYALCNRSADKHAAADLINVETKALLLVDMDNYPPEECPYCNGGIFINQQLGHGKKFLEELATRNPEKARWLGWRG